MYPNPNILRRAEHLVVDSNGNVAKELGEEDARKRRGRSFRRTIQGIRSRSAYSTALPRGRLKTGTRSSAVDDSLVVQVGGRTGHSRSLTDLTAMLSHPRSAPTSQAAHGPSTVAKGEQYASSMTELPDIGSVKTLKILQQGTLMTKVSAKKQKTYLFRLDADLGQIAWVSKRHKIIPIENIKEIRSGHEARHNREHLQLAIEYQDRWITIIYILDGHYKTLHLVAPDNVTFQMWDHSVRALHAIRQDLMRGIGNGEMREALWERHYWKAADEEPDHRLTFSEIEGLCRKLNINSSHDELLRLFKQADTRNREYLDFDDFRKFVKLLKARPEIDRLYKRLRKENGDTFDIRAFEAFIREKQKSNIPANELHVLFDKFSTTEGESTVMTLQGFSSFLLSSENTAFSDQHKAVWQDMTRPLSEYFISSSHNTYLVGHQLVGLSTTEGYIRALLHSCRCVEVDVFDGEDEPMVTHGLTLTTKVSLREVCKAIMEYGFKASPYPIIISAEVHCSLPQQDMIAFVMIEEFGESLLRVPTEGMSKIEALPSPEELKNKILFKTKNAHLVHPETLDSDSWVTDFSTSAEASASESDFFEKRRVFRERLHDDPHYPSETSVKSPFSKAGHALLQRVKSARGGRKSAPIVIDHPTAAPAPILSDRQLLATSPPAMTDMESVRSISSRGGAGPPPTRPPFFQRARRFRHSHSTSTSTSDSSPPLNADTPLPGTSTIPHPSRHSFLDRVRKAKSSSMPSRAASANPDVRRPKEDSLISATKPKPLALSTVAAQAGAAHKGAASDTDAHGHPKRKMSKHMLELLVYTVGVKCRGLNKKEEYAPEHMFSLSERMANKMLKVGMWDLIKHTRSHLVRTYPKGSRVNSTNYLPHRFWAAGMQLVALNWQTFDLGYMINNAMFQRNGRAGYVLKPHTLRQPQKELFVKRTSYVLDVTVISAQQLPRPKDAFGHEITDKADLDPFVEVTVFTPDWPVVPESKSKGKNSPDKAKKPKPVKRRSMPEPRPVSPTALDAGMASTPSVPVTKRTAAVKKNGFNPTWEEHLQLSFDCVADMMDLIFVRFVVRQEEKDMDEPLGVYCVSLGSLQQGYRHLPLHDSQLSQYLFSTLFVRIHISSR
ncbi:hypothetical protein D9619_010084 [Psilocybe cf. subviscida]|uniref:Phosphoinositide phospholipase C n=1 Tax=Psilocybe cf. subviscida TaxID=2480587 RepID=A0A8H5BNE8_9AGAR|nr:hypothetical protein D9619_010084 [Psilocybe cf. subviscida]